MKKTTFPVVSLSRRAVLRSLLATPIFACVPFAALADEPSKPSRPTKSRDLVVYYTYSRQTERVAKRLAKTLGADLYAVETLESYPSEPKATAERAQEERRLDRLPKIADKRPNLSVYDRVFIGGPTWSGVVSAPLVRYLRETDFRGKTVVSFWTAENSDGVQYRRDFAEQLAAPERKPALHVDENFGFNAVKEATDAELDAKIAEFLPKLSTVPASPPKIFAP